MKFYVTTKHQLKKKQENAEEKFSKLKEMLSFSWQQGCKYLLIYSGNRDFVRWICGNVVTSILVFNVILLKSCLVGEFGLISRL